MKQISTKNKIICIISILVVIAGIIVVMLNGFNVEEKYQGYKKIKMYVDQEVDISKIETIATEVFGENVAKVQVLEMYSDGFQIIASEITEEQKNAVVDKINELYPVEAEETTTENNDETSETTTNVRINSDDVEILSASNVRLRDLFKPYVIPFITSTIIILAYLAIRYRKLGVIKVILQTGGILVLTQIVLLSILGIIRFPIGRFVPAMVLIVYMLTILDISNKWKNVK